MNSDEIVDDFSNFRSFGGIDKGGTIFPKKGKFLSRHAPILDVWSAKAFKRIHIHLDRLFSILHAPKTEGTWTSNHTPSFSHVIHKGIFLPKTIRSVFVRGDRLIVHYSMRYYSFGIRTNPTWNFPKSQLQGGLIYRVVRSHLQNPLWKMESHLTGRWSNFSIISFTG